MAFDRVYGQDRVKRLLEAGIERGRLAHAYLFHGPPGVGKDAMALSMAMGFFCEQAMVGGCGDCPSCANILRLDHPPFHAILPVPSRPRTMKQEKYDEILRERTLARISNPYREVTFSPEISTLPVIGIEQVRGMKKEVILKAAGGMRVFWVSHAEAMNPEAANSLLKLLEEPPPGTILLLTTSTPTRLLKTIVSRCQTVRFDPLSDEEIESALTTGWSFPEDRARFFARLAGGSLQNALELSEEGAEERRRAAADFLEQGLRGDEASWVRAVEELAGPRDKAEVLRMLRTLQVWIRDILLRNLGSPERIMNTDAVGALDAFHGEWPDFDAERAMKATEQSVDYVEKNVYLNLLLFDLLREFSACSGKGRSGRKI